MWKADHDLWENEPITVLPLPGFLCACFCVWFWPFYLVHCFISLRRKKIIVIPFWSFHIQLCQLLATLFLKRYLSSAARTGIQVPRGLLSLVCSRMVASGLSESAFQGVVLTWVTWKSISLSLYWFRSQGTWSRAYSQRSSRWSSRLTEGPWAFTTDKVCRGSKEIALVALHYAFRTGLSTPGDLHPLPWNFLTAFNQDIFLKNFKIYLG